MVEEEEEEDIKVGEWGSRKGFPFFPLQTRVVAIYPKTGKREKPSLN